MNNQCVCPFGKYWDWRARRCKRQIICTAGRIKRAVQSGVEVPFESGLTIEREHQQQLFESNDAREGLDAYVEKRKPEFAGN